MASEAARDRRGRTASALGLAERLVAPQRARWSRSYVAGARGAELRIDAGSKSVTFYDPRLFALGEELATRTCFTGAEAVTWGPGYAWDEIRPLLEALLDEGLLERGGAEGG
jgi:hypothetical protein